MAGKGDHGKIISMLFKQELIVRCLRPVGGIRDKRWKGTLVKPLESIRIVGGRIRLPVHSNPVEYFIEASISCDLEIGDWAHAWEHGI